MCCLERCPAIGASDLVCLGRNQAAPRRTVGAVQPFLGTNVPRRVDWNDGLMRLMCVFFWGGFVFWTTLVFYLARASVERMWYLSHEC